MDIVKKFLFNYRFQIFISFILLSLLTYLFPYTGDDWAWGTQVGIERLSSWFSNYNGRYVGNVLVLIFSRSRILKCLFMSLVIVLLCYNLNVFINKNNKKIYWISLVLIMLTPKLVMAQTIVWLSGFTNYVVPTMFILMYLNLFKYVFEDSFEYKGKKCFYAMLLGFSNSLIMENITIYNICISFILLIYTYWKHKKVDKVQICYLFFSIIGAFFMFSNEAYSSIASNQDTYRSVSQDTNIFINIKNLYFDKFCTMFFINNKIISIVISILATIYLNNLKTLNNKTLIILKKIISYYLILYSLYLVLVTLNTTWNIVIQYTKYIEGISAIIWCLSLLITVLIEFGSNSLMRKAFTFEMSFIILLAPLFVVTPIWYRNVFPLYIMLVALALCLYENCKDLICCSKQFIISALLCSYLYLVSVYGYVYIVEQRRISKIEVNNNINDVLVLKKLPYRDYLWMTEPNGDMWIERFKLFYDIPEEVKLKFID